MKRTKRTFFLALSGMLLLGTLPGCGYHIGGLKPKALASMKTFNVVMMENRSLEPQAGVLMTSALTDVLQRDGTYEIATRNAGDFRIEGCVTGISFRQERSSYTDSYLSTEIGLQLFVTYNVYSNKTGKLLTSGSTTATSTFFNSGNVQTARTNALSYAVRRAAENIADRLTNG
ncbi:LPS assembly lipoprotein LptE [Akkermansia glycaniphila]|uniref:Lipopolysaccharide-assembly n=1 Tax=Akkermansia glycaniphila TaxID=1679444 RepID=A0A1C7PEE9_9BACT|nr:LPS assembly lipoprotein LptE [Akkermansia glycaniphila]OCA03828.1 hypothetical protein AC781_02450 [Akkermansia glycaniphila]SEH69223.1 lipopolysaccharide-assembly [Akkermansia glycaniphila]